MCKGTIYNTYFTISHVCRLFYSTSGLKIEGSVKTQAFLTSEINAKSMKLE